MAIVKADKLVKRYPRPGAKNEDFLAVDGVSLAIEAGEVFGILGPNGAGKTTTLEMLEGLTDIDGGRPGFPASTSGPSRTRSRRSSGCSCRRTSISIT